MTTPTRRTVAAVMPTTPPPHAPFLPVILLAAMLLAPVTAGAAVDSRTWGQRVEKSDTLLRQGEYAAAYEITAPLLDELGLYLQPDARSNAALGAVLALQALAEAGTGRTEAALWHWHLSQSLKPDLRTTDLSVYGAAGELLAPHRFPVDEDGGCVAQAHEGVGTGDDGEPLRLGEEVTPPVKVHAPAPRYSLEERKAGFTGRVIIQVILDREGRLRAPYLLKADAPSFAYRAAETIRDWRFEPARVDGEPVATYYNLTVNFTLGR